MDPITNFKIVFSKAFDFNGKANRPEYWYFALYAGIIQIFLPLIGFFIFLIPSISVTIRRLHDIDKSGWNILWSFTIIGIPYVIYLNALPSLDSSNYVNKPIERKGSQQSKIESEEIIKDEDVKGQGSGVILTKDGIIATNNHVIEGAKKINIQMLYENDIQNMNAKILRTNPNNDLAILKIDDKKFKGFSDIPYVIKNDTVDIATEVYALGYPLALSIMGTDVKFTEGRISSKTGFQGDVTSYQISNPIQPGNSGGPVFNYDGEIIGIVSSKVQSKAADNVGYAIKSSHIFTFIDALPQKISLNTSDNLLSKLSLTEQIKLVKDFIVMIKV